MYAESLGEFRRPKFHRTQELRHPHEELALAVSLLFSGTGLVDLFPMPGSGRRRK